MSGVEESDETEMMCCASCGTAEVDDIKLKKCACNLVKYCSAACQKDHRPQHKEACKKRVAELREELLFKQPESSHFGDCPICFLPLAIDERKSPMMACCSKHICIGCGYANSKREVEENLEPKCPYCREKIPTTKKQIKTHLMRRIKVNDPVALRQMGSLCFHDGDYSGAFEYWIKAAGLGEVGAHFELSCLYRDGQGVEKDRKKQMYHLEEAAIGGDPVARNNLGCVLGRSFWDADSMGRAVKHFIIAAKLGHDGSLSTLRQMYMKQVISKEDYAAALRGHQAAVDATKSPLRNDADIHARGEYKQILDF